MKIDKRIISVVLICILTAAAMPSGRHKEEVRTPVEITFMHGWGGTLKTHKVMQEIYDNFSRQNPDITVKYLPYSDSSIAVEKANDMLAVGKAPDILSTNGLSYYVKNASGCGMLIDLMPYIEADPEWKKQIHPSVFETWETSNGRLFTIPDALEVAGYWNNEAYLKAAGIVNEQGEAALPHTWEEFIAMTRGLQSWIERTGAGGSVFAMDDAQMTEFLFLARLAGENENGLASARNPYVKLEYDTLANTLRDLDVIHRYSRKVNSVDNARQCFLDGESIIYFNGVWEGDMLRDSARRAEFKYANYPANGGKSLAYLSPSSGYVLSQQTDVRKSDACIRFLKYMGSDEVQMKIALSTGQAPSNPDIDSAYLSREYPLLGNAINQAYQADIQIKTIRSVWPEPKTAALLHYISQESWHINDVDDMLTQLNEK